MTKQEMTEQILGKDREEEKLGGDRRGGRGYLVVITMNSKFLPYRKW